MAFPPVASCALPHFGTQPLCYCRDLVLEDCVFEEDCDLAFEDSEVNAILLSPVTSVKNPMRGSITAETIKEIIIDGFSKAVEPVKIISSNAI